VYVEFNIIQLRTVFEQGYLGFILTGLFRLSKYGRSVLFFFVKPSSPAMFLVSGRLPLSKISGTLYPPYTLQVWFIRVGQASYLEMYL